MRKIFLPILVIFLSACTLNSSATPKQKVSEFLDKYKKEHTNVIEQLEETIDSSFSNEEYKKRYKNLILNQYKNLKYEVTDEVIEDKTAVVEVEVSVLDYGSAISKADDYLTNHQEEFKEKENVDENKFENYKLSQMENVDSVVKYKIEFTLSKNQKGEWEIDPLSDTDLEKLHGIYYE